MFYPALSHDFRYFLRLLKPWRTVLAHHDVESSVRFGKEKFQADLDVQNFKPENLKIRVTEDNVITVEGKHEEKQDGDGYVSRHFVRRLVLPKGHDMTKGESRVSSDGVLTVSAPRVVEEEVGKEIPIAKTGKPYWGDGAKGEEKK